MKRLLLVILVAALGWSGYWFVGAQSLRDGISRWFENRQDAGWIAAYSAVSVRGFPNRFDTNFTDLELADTRTGWAWSVDFFQLFSLSYKPTHLIAVWPPQQKLSTPTKKLAINSADMRASLVVDEPKSLALDRSSFVAKDLTVTNSDQTGVRANLLSLALQRRDLATHSYQIALSVKGLSPLEATRKQIDPTSILPSYLQLLKADMTIAFDRPWDRSALETLRPQPTAIELHLAQATWGALNLKIAGKLAIDGAGWARGDVTVKASQWREILDLTRSTGQLPDQVIDMTEKALGFLAQLKGQGSSLDLTLTLKDQKIFFGPIAIAPAPRLHLR
ncbi:DUF2125 domain-containing protein [Paracoccaceae bacterium]|nr:DUF2125 domain-containing protein [Paracoccaceae bacterium]